MYVAIDDTDSREGMCTSYLLAKMIAEMPYDLIGLPRLVRLNPAVPWKTRGNGALTMRVGIGGGSPRTIGGCDGDDIVFFPRLKKEVDADELVDLFLPLIEEHQQPGSNPGFVVSRTKPPQSFYWKGVRDILEIEEVETMLDDMGAVRHGIGDGRGIIGATCGMAWRPRDRSLEMLAYRDIVRWGSERTLSISSVERMDALYPSTFNNIELRWRKVAISPSTPCPVLLGVRGDDLDDLLEARKVLEGEEPAMWLTFLSNQGSDDHIIEDASELLPDRSYRLRMTVSSQAIENKGGFVIIRSTQRGQEMDCAAYEPSKEFREVVRALRPGDEIEAFGELRDSPRTLNLEKLRVLSVADVNVKKGNPRCPRCGKAAKSVGKDAGYRCRHCSVHIPEDEVPMEREARILIPGWYEPPVCARRHLSKPLCRMGLYQPLDFV